MKRSKKLIRLFSIFLMLCFCLTSFATSPVETSIPVDEKEAACDDSLSSSGLDISELTIDDMPDELVEGAETELEKAAALDTEDAETLNSLTLVNEDGSKTLFLFEQPIKYIDEKEGSIKFIDNALTELDEDDIYAFTNAANDIDIAFPENIEDGVLMVNAQGISFIMCPVTDEDITAENAEYKEDDLIGTPQQVVEYADAFGEGTYLQYASINTGLKENIILDEYTGINSFQFIINAPGLIPDKQTGETINLIDEQTGEVAYVIEQTYIQDSYVDEPDGATHITYDNYYTIEDLGNYEYLLTSILDREFLESETTVYPVLVDPTVSVSVSNTTSATVYQNLGAVPGQLWNEIGYCDSYKGAARVYIKTNQALPSYINPEKISSAYYRAYECSGNTHSASGLIFDSTFTTSVGNVTWSQVNLNRLYNHFAFNNQQIL